MNKKEVSRYTFKILFNMFKESEIFICIILKYFVLA